jgi:hypothetical protein
MTRRDQILRQWIARRHVGGTWVSHISHRGAVDSLDTGTRLRPAAIDFAALHLRSHILHTKPPQLPLHHTPELFPEK